MTGKHEFRVTIQPVPENHDQLSVDVEYIRWIGREADISRTRWTCQAENGQKVIQEALLASCKWLNNYVEKRDALSQVS